MDSSPHMPPLPYKSRTLALKLEHADLMLDALEATTRSAIQSPDSNRDLFVSASLLIEDYKNCLDIESKKIELLHKQMAAFAQDSGVSFKAFEMWIDASLVNIDRVLEKLSHVEQIFTLTSYITLTKAS